MKKILNDSGIFEFGVVPFDILKEHLHSFASKDRLPQNAQSVAVMLFPYLTKPSKRNISLYAVVPDYHKIIGDKLNLVCEALKAEYKEYSFVHFCDNSPVMEVKSAALAGLGVIGKNNLLINKTFGSYVFIAEIVTDMPLEYSVHEIKYCNGCNKCVKACPSKALCGEFKKDLCLSYITQKKEPLSKDEEALIKKTGIIWGCDICSESCPMNARAKMTNIKEFLDGAQPIITNENYNKIKDRAYAWRGEKVIKRNINI